MEHEADLIDFQSDSGSKSQSFGANLMVKAALSRSARYKQFVDTDEDEPVEETVSQLHLAPPAKVEMESSSDYVEEDASECTRKRADFGYQELDDEYGSRPGGLAPKAPRDNGKEITSSQEFDSSALKQANVNPPDMVSSTQAQADRIVGHEFGVKPLLDDDELEDGTVYSRGVHGPMNASNASAVDRDTRSSSIEASSDRSPGFSPQNTEDHSDIFAAAPFRISSAKKRRPFSAVVSGTSSLFTSAANTDIFDRAPFKTKSHTKLISPPEGAEMETDRKQESGYNPPTVFRTTQSSAATTPSSVAISPDMRPSSLSPHTETYVVSRVAPPLARDPYNQLPEAGTTDPIGCVSQPFPTAFPQISQDLFGTIPFSEVPVSTVSTEASRPLVTSTPQKPYNAAIPKQLADKAVNDTPGPAAVVSPRHQRPEDLLLQYDETYAIPSMPEASSSSKHSKRSSKSKKNSRDITSVAFSNMSFHNDDDDLESPNFDEFNNSYSSLELSGHLKASPKGMQLSPVRPPSYTKTTSPSSATKTPNMKLGSSYDTATWPRKHRKLPPSSTAEPFTVHKKKAEGLFRV